jgi:hypothetical protein
MLEKNFCAGSQDSNSSDPVIWITGRFVKFLDEKILTFRVLQRWERFPEASHPALVDKFAGTHEICQSQRQP